MNKLLYVIPARGGSKGVPNKNGRLLNGFPLIYYTIREVLKIADPKDICFSSDSIELIRLAESYGLQVPFVRPDDLSTDTATTRNVLLHALDYYMQNGKTYDTIVLLQPTSPLRVAKDIERCIAFYDSNVDAVVSVKETSANPYYVLFEENEEGFLKKSKDGNFLRRQDCPVVYELNGAVYIIRADKLRLSEITSMDRLRKSIMPPERSIDIDSEFDFKLAEFLLSNKVPGHDYT